MRQDDPVKMEEVDIKTFTELFSDGKNKVGAPIKELCAKVKKVKKDIEYNGSKFSLLEVKDTDKKNLTIYISAPHDVDMIEKGQTNILKNLKVAKTKKDYDEMNCRRQEWRFFTWDLEHLSLK